MTVKTLSVIVPAYNERATIEVALRRLYAVPLPTGWMREVVVVDDGSTDGTGAVLESVRQPFGFVLERRARNAGKGAAVRVGIARARGTHVLIQDADLEYDPADIPALLMAIDAGADAVFGVRDRKLHSGYLLYRIGATVLGAALYAVSGAAVRDFYTGYKLLPLPLLRSLALESDGFELEAEITCKLLARGVRIVSVPVSYAPRSFADGKKIGPRDALRGLAALWKWRRG